jgi:hypothetical protein
MSDTNRPYDGDTLYEDGHGYRLRGVDTPELKQGEAGAVAARERFAELLRSGEFRRLDFGKDNTGTRTVSEWVNASGESIGAVMAREGYGSATAAYGTPETIAAAYERAKAFEQGVAPRAMDEVMPTQVTDYMQAYDGRGFASRAWDRGVDQLQMMGGAAMEAGGVQFGWDWAEEKGRGIKERNFEEAARSPRDVDSWQDVVDSDGVLDTLSSAGKYALESAIENAPQMLVDVGVGVAAAAAAPFTGGGSLAAGGGALAGRQALTSAMRSQLAKTMGRNFSLGMLASNYTQMTGESYHTMQQNGVPDEEAAATAIFATGPLNAVLEQYADRRLLSALKIGGRGAVTRARDILIEAGKQAGIQIPIEGATELAQSWTTELASTFRGKGGNMTQDDYIEAFLRGAAAGGVMAGSGRAVTATAEYAMGRSPSDTGTADTQTDPDTQPDLGTADLQQETSDGGLGDSKIEAPQQGASVPPHVSNPPQEEAQEQSDAVQGNESPFDLSSEVERMAAEKRQADAEQVSVNSRAEAEAEEAALRSAKAPAPKGPTILPDSRSQKDEKPDYTPAPLPKKKETTEELLKRAEELGLDPESASTTYKHGVDRGALELDLINALASETSLSKADAEATVNAMSDQQLLIEAARYGLKAKPAKRVTRDDAAMAISTLRSGLLVADGYRGNDVSGLFSLLGLDITGTTMNESERKDRETGSLRFNRRIAAKMESPEFKSALRRFRKKASDKEVARVVEWLRRNYKRVEGDTRAIPVKDVSRAALATSIREESPTTDKAREAPEHTVKKAEESAAEAPVLLDAALNSVSSRLLDGDQRLTADDLHEREAKGAETIAQTRLRVVKDLLADLAKAITPDELDNLATGLKNLGQSTAIGRVAEAMRGNTRNLSEDDAKRLMPALQTLAKAAGRESWDTRENRQLLGGATVDLDKDADTLIRLAEIRGQSLTDAQARAILLQRLPEGVRDAAGQAVDTALRRARRLVKGQIAGESTDTEGEWKGDILGAAARLGVKLDGGRISQVFNAIADERVMTNDYEERPESSERLSSMSFFTPLFDAAINLKTQILKQIERALKPSEAGVVRFDQNGELSSISGIPRNKERAFAGKEIVSLDFETYYEKDVYSANTMPFSEYLANPKTYQVFMLAVTDAQGSRVLEGEAAIAEYINELRERGDEVVVTAYNAQFDFGILKEKFGYVPPIGIDAMALYKGLKARNSPAEIEAINKSGKSPFSLHWATRNILSRKYAHLHKKDEGALENLSGKTLDDLTQEQRALLDAYAETDAAGTAAITDAMLHFIDQQTAQNLADVTSWAVSPTAEGTPFELTFGSGARDAMGNLKNSDRLARQGAARTRTQRLGGRNLFPVARIHLEQQDSESDVSQRVDSVLFDALALTWRAKTRAEALQMFLEGITRMQEGTYDYQEGYYDGDARAHAYMDAQYNDQLVIAEIDGSPVTYGEAKLAQRYGRARSEGDAKARKELGSYTDNETGDFAESNSDIVVGLQFEVERLEALIESDEVGSGLANVNGFSEESLDAAEQYLADLTDSERSATADTSDIRRLKKELFPRIEVGGTTLDKVVDEYLQALGDIKRYNALKVNEAVVIDSNVGVEATVDRPDFVGSLQAEADVYASRLEIAYERLERAQVALEDNPRNEQALEDQVAALDMLRELEDEQTMAERERRISQPRAVVTDSTTIENLPPQEEGSEEGIAPDPNVFGRTRHMRKVPAAEQFVGPLPQLVGPRRGMGDRVRGLVARWLSRASTLDRDTLRSMLSTLRIQVPVALVEQGQLDSFITDLEAQAKGRSATDLASIRGALRQAKQSRSGYAYVNAGDFAVIVVADRANRGKGRMARAQHILKMAHEVGHLVMDLSYHNAPEKVKTAVYEDYKAYRKSLPSKARANASFSEWYADQVAAVLAQKYGELPRVDTIGAQEAQWSEGGGRLDQAARAEYNDALQAYAEAARAANVSYDRGYAVEENSAVLSAALKRLSKAEKAYFDGKPDRKASGEGRRAPEQVDTNTVSAQPPRFGEYKGAGVVTRNFFKRLVASLRSVFDAARKALGMEAATETFESYVDGLITGRYRVDRAMPKRAPTAQFFTPKEAVAKAVERAKKGDFPMGRALWQTAIGTVRRHSPELADALFKGANKTAGSGVAYEQRHDRILGHLKAVFGKTYNDLAKGARLGKRDEQVRAALDAYVAGEKTPATAKVKAMMDEMDTFLKKYMPEYDRKGPLPMAFDHGTVEAKRAEFIELLRANKAFADEPISQLERAVDMMISSDGNTAFAVGPGHPVGMHDFTSRVIDAIGEEELLEKGFLIDKPERVLVHFIAGASKRAAWEATFGGYETVNDADTPVAQRKPGRMTKKVWRPNKKYLAFEEQILEQKGVKARDEVRATVRGALGLNLHSMSHRGRRVQEEMANITSFAILSGSGIASIAEIGVAVFRGMEMAGLRGVLHAIKDYRQARRLAYDLGVVADNSLELLMRTADEGYEAVASRKATGYFFIANGQAAMTRVSRVMGLSMARQAFIRAAQDGDTEALAQFHLTPEHVQRWLDSGESKHDELMVQAMHTFVREATLTNSTFVNTRWQNNPYFALVAYLKRFLWVAGENILMSGARGMTRRFKNVKGDMGVEAALLYAATPYLVGGAVMMLLGGLSLEIRDLFTGKDTMGTAPTLEKFNLMFSRMGGYGPFEVILNLKKAHEWDQTLIGSIAAPVGIAERSVRHMTSGEWGKWVRLHLPLL